MVVAGWPSGAGRTLSWRLPRAVSQARHTDRMDLESRSLGRDERAVLDLLLSIDFDGVARLREQASSALVAGKCDCGCPSIELTVSEEVPRAAMPHRLAPVEGVVAPTADGPAGEVILFVDDGRLSYLEYVHYSDPPPSDWPAIERITATVFQR